jgi:hypothetical protein
VRSTTTAYFQPQLTTGPGGRLALMAFALPVRTGQASVMLSMKQSNPPDSGLAP